MKIKILVLSLVFSQSAFATSPYLSAVKSRCHRTAEIEVRSRMTKWQNMWSRFLSENLGERPLYLRSYAACMLKTARRSAVSAGDRQKLNVDNILANIRSRRGTDPQITEWVAKSTVCFVNQKRPMQLHLLWQGYAHIGRIPNDRRFDWYWQAVEKMVQESRVDDLQAHGFCKVEPI